MVVVVVVVMMSDGGEIVPTIYEWHRHPWIAGTKFSDEMYGMVPSKSLPSMGIPSIHGWRMFMSGMQHEHQVGYSPLVLDCGDGPTVSGKEDQVLFHFRGGHQ